MPETVCRENPQTTTPFLRNSALALLALFCASVLVLIWARSYAGFVAAFDFLGVLWAAICIAAAGHMGRVATIRACLVFVSLLAIFGIAVVVLQ